MGRRGSTLTVFVDSSVLFSAVYSPSGGSAKLFTIKNLRLQASLVVLAEVEKNVRRKLYANELERFFFLTDKLMILKQKPNDKLIREAEKVIAKKDSVILAEAKQAKADILVTLDRKHFLTIEARNFLKPQKIFTPKMLFELLDTSLL